MVQMHTDLAGQGFEVLAFPCNQFGAQEPGTHEEIQKFVTDNFGAKFPLFAKVDVNGEGTHPVYGYLKKNSSLLDSESK